METIKYTDLRRLALEQYGQTNSRASDELKSRFRGLLGRRLAKIWQAEEWPEITFTEERRFAPVYNTGAVYQNGDFVYYPPTKNYYQCVRSSTGNSPVDANDDVNQSYWAAAAQTWGGADWTSGTSYVVGDVVYYEPVNRYYQCLQATSSIEPNAASGGSFWGELHPFRLRIDYQQTEATVGVSTAAWLAGTAAFSLSGPIDLKDGDTVTVASVTPDGYNGRRTVSYLGHPEKLSLAIASDPGSYSSGGTVARYYRRIGEVFAVTSADPALDAGYRSFRPYYDDFGVIVPDATATVWVRHRLKLPQFLGDDYDSTTTYAVGDQMLFTDGDFYEATAATSAGESPTTDPGKWAQVELPARFTEYLVNGAVADALRMDGNHEGANVQLRVAEDWLTLETDKLYRQSGQYRPLTVTGY